MKQQSKKKDRIIVRLLQEARPIWKWLALAAVLCTGIILFAILGPKLLGGLIDRLYDYWDGTFTGDLLAALLPPIGALAAVYAGYSLLSYLKMLLLNRVVSRYFTCTLRIRISDKIRRLFDDRRHCGDDAARGLALGADRAGADARIDLPVVVPVV